MNDTGAEGRMLGERWRCVVGHEGRYEVSNLGRVRSVARVVACRAGKRVVEGMILTASLGSNGYPRVGLGRGAEAMVHRLVADAWVPGAGQVVRHLDGNPMNCVATNLAWGSFSDNEADKKRHGRVTQGAKHPNAKMTDDHVRSIREMSARGFSQLAIAKSLGLKRGVVGIVVRGEGWTHVS